jgi:hypothetical protein
MKYLVIALLLLSTGISLGNGSASAAFPQTHKLTGRWRVKYVLTANGEKNLVLDLHNDGSATILLLDTGPDGKASSSAQPALWSETTMNRINFSSEVELPLGTCCRDVGTLMLKGKLDKEDSISGKSVFVTSTIDEESPTGFRSMVGTFTATRERSSSQ